MYDVRLRESVLCLARSQNIAHCSVETVENIQVHLVVHWSHCVHVILRAKLSDLL